ncbi:MAG: hypothetical protein IJE10_07900 [Clostridia bacterium]|nr:hypothetical protein [Clostridia bacterium]
MKKSISMMLVLLLVFSMMPFSAFASELKKDNVYIVLGPEGFTDLGNWQVQTDPATGYKIIMGATNSVPSLDTPATIKVCLPKEGTYKLWVLSKDFATMPGTRPYTVQLGSVITQQFGAHCVDGFSWEATDPFMAFGGEQVVSVIDSKGNCARCAAIVITDDLDFTPPTSKEDVEALISAHQYKEGDYTFSPDADFSGRPDSEIAVKLNGEWMTFDVDPILLNDRTMVPFRAIFEALGCVVSWDDENQTAMGRRNGLEVSLPIDDVNVKVNRKPQTLDQPAVLLNDRTLVPLRFVSEALGAQVSWDDTTQTVSILANVPEEMVLFTQESYTDVGTWVMEQNADGAFNTSAMRGAVPSDINATLEDADASNNKPAIAPFELSKGGTYRIWVRSKDFAQNQQGHRFFNLQFNDRPMLEHKYGTHGDTGYKWATGGTIELPAGKNTMYVHDTSGFYARYDAILLSKDLDYVPAENYQTVTRNVMPYNNVPDFNLSFPAYANEEGTPTESTSIENEDTKVVFYKVPTSRGQVVQNEIYAKHNGQWVKTKNRNEDLGYLVYQATEAGYSVSRDIYGISMKYNYDGNTYGGLTEDPYKAGAPHYFIPTDYVADANGVTLVSENETGVLKATWRTDAERYPLVSIDFSPSTNGYYSIAVWEGKGFEQQEYSFALAPLRIQYKRVPEEPQLLTEQYLYTPMGTLTLYDNNAYSNVAVTKGVVFDPSWIPQRWVYDYNSILGITMHGLNGLHRGTAFAPVMGSKESKMDAGSTYNLRVRIVSDVADWFDSYSVIAEDLFDVDSYRKNYIRSLNDVIFNTRDLILDDKYAGWDVYDKAHYNMESSNTTSMGNSMQALQDYLLSEDEEMLERRTIPTIANALTRKNLHFNRIGEGNGPYLKTDSISPIGEPIKGFNANIMLGMYEMSQGAIPFLYDYGVEKGNTEVVNTYGSIPPFANDIAMYQHTGEQKYLDNAIALADKYLEEEVYKESYIQQDWNTFVYISCVPNMSSLLDMYELTDDKKYLDAAEYVAQVMTTCLWVPGVDGDKRTNLVEANNLEEIQKNFVYNSEVNSTMWWAGPSQMRIGREGDLSNTSHNNDIITGLTKNVEGWLPSRVSLGIEQPSTFVRSAHIVMQSFVGDFMKLSAYTGEDFYANLAQNSILGRYNSYEGYYRSAFMTYEQETNYPVDGPDYTGIYWHHLPPYIAMLEDFLINQTYAFSGQNIEFPALRQQGYAYFNSNQYGHKPGKFYDEADMWPWLAKGIVEPDSIQIDWMAARKDGVVGIAFMNEDFDAVTTTIKLGDKIEGGANYNGTATLYDKTGKIGTVDVVNGAFTLTVPSKSLQAVKLNIDTVKAPSFAALRNQIQDTQIGATVSHHKAGKGYTLQMSADHYYAYVYTTHTQADIQSATLTYQIDGGEKKTETATVYPFEFIIKVDNPDAVFTYTLSETMKDGSVVDAGSGKLMTALKSKAEGIVYEKPTASAPSTPSAPSTGSDASVSDEAKALKFKSTEFEIVQQGSQASEFRFVIDTKVLPFELTATNALGLKVTADLVDKGETQKMDGFVSSVELRDGGRAVLVIKSNINASNYGSGTGPGMTHKWEKITIHPFE